ncbi:Rrf2 family transcriptional regulator [Erwinia sp. HR93]|uniref:RrF2 family transcriptional regulator n=1 Tax=Erwinia sp. HR93 TaxID=3094840 RepID=UPI002ADECAC2|nr:Rrf2 family transcriptional regulator [Erwinia sp. HR93]MEA1065017.1 Rrf2 family transcriptional regulator [Erwinia sp. HR93]
MSFFSSGVEYAIHSLMCMVDDSGNGREMSVREIAELHGMPYDYLGKVFTRLAKAGLVSSLEGRNGGYQLARSPAEITIRDVALAIDENKTLFDCREVRQRMAVFDSVIPVWACDTPCSVRLVMDEAQRQMYESLARHTILSLTRRMLKKVPDSYPIQISEWLTQRRSG